MNREMTVDGVRIADETETYVIAEIGNNHQGDLEKCKELFKVAKQHCGVHAVKLQKRDNKTLFTRAMYNQEYNSENAFADTYGAHREKLEFGRDEYVELIAYAKELGITFFATAFDRPSALSPLPSYSSSMASIICTRASVGARRSASSSRMRLSASALSARIGMTR